jgi:protein TonB
MSGLLDRAYSSLPSRDGLPEILSPVERRKRLSLAVVLSFMLHALLALMPSPGTGTREAPAIANVLEVRLEKSDAPAARLPVPLPAVPAPPPVAPEPASSATELSRGLDVLPAPAAPYFTTDRLTRRPLPVSQPLLNVPRQMARYVTGGMVLKIWINERGGVDEVEVEKSDLPKAVSDHAAAAFRRVQFVPGELHGKRVGVLMRVEVAYVDGRAVGP